MNARGWIIYNGNLASNKFLDFANMLQEAASALNSKTQLLRNNELLSLLSSTHLELVPHHKLPDYVVFIDKDIYLAKQLEYLGIPVFNTADAIAISDDKIATYQRLAQKKLPIPKTIIAPKIFEVGTLDEEIIEQVVQMVKFPLIIKEAFGSFGEQVYLVHSIKELQQKITEIGHKPFVFQEFIAASSGVDLRLQVVGDEVVTAMKRTSETDFRANVAVGGKVSAYTPSDEEKALAIAATKAIGADFAGVDLLFGKNSPLVCEVNSNGLLRGLYEATGINAAENILKYVLQKISK